MSLVFQWKDTTTLTVEADRLAPERLAGLAATEVARQPIHLGNAMAEVGDLFLISETSADPNSLCFEGNLRSLHGLGRRDEPWRVTIRGDVGPYVGAAMTGGMITVEGNVADFAGAEMHGGRIEIRGDAGRFLGGSLPGSRLGMRDGIILVHGSAGEEVGRRMRRGLIAVGKNAGDFCGKGMIAGSIFVFGSVGKFAGSGMKRGTIGLFGHTDEAPLAFSETGTFRFPWLTIYLRRLNDWGFPVAPEMFSSAFARYNGDLSAGGQGEILVRSR